MSMHDLAGPYALDELDSQERARFEMHLDECEACRTEVEAFEMGLIAFAESVAERPPASLKRQVMRQVRGEPERKPFWSRFVVWAPVAAAAVAIIALATVALLKIDDITADDIAAAPDARVIQMAPDLEIVVSASHDAGFIRGSGLAIPTADLYYEMWLIDPDGEVESVGVWEPGEVVVFEGDLDSVVAFAITEEPVGGEPGPEGPVVAQAEL